MVTWGSGLAAILLVGASMIFAWYVEAFDSCERIYGSLGAAVGFMDLAVGRRRPAWRGAGRRHRAKRQVKGE